MNIHISPLHLLDVYKRQDLLEAKAFPSYTLACTMIGYILGIIVIPKYISQKNALTICTVLGLSLIHI